MLSCYLCNPVKYSPHFKIFHHCYYKTKHYLSTNWRYEYIFWISIARNTLNWNRYATDLKKIGKYFKAKLTRARDFNSWITNAFFFSTYSFLSFHVKVLANLNFILHVFSFWLVHKYLSLFNPKRLLFYLIYRNKSR